MKRFKLRNLDVDRVDLVDRGANQHAEIVIHKGVNARALIAKNMKEGYPSDTQLKNGPPPVASTTLTPKDMDEDEKKKKKKGAKGSAFPERNAAESSTSAGSAPVEKHNPGGQSHDQNNHGKAGSGKGKKSSVSGDARPGSKGGVSRAKKDSIKGDFFREAGLDGKTSAAQKAKNRQHHQDLVASGKLGESKGSGRATRHGSAPGDLSVRTDPKFDDAAEELKNTKLKGTSGAGFGMTREDFERAQGRDKNVRSPGVPTKDAPGPETFNPRFGKGKFEKHTPGGQSHNQQNHAGGSGGGGKASGPAKSGSGSSPKRRSLNSIAREIKSDWGPKVNFGAKPYLDAMGNLDSIHDNFYYDSGSSVVAYFLANAGTWRGDTARKVKAELKSMLKDKPPPPASAPLTDTGKKVKEQVGKAFPPKKGLPPQGPPQAGPPQGAPPPQAGKGLPKLSDVLGKPTDTKQAVPPGSPAPGKPAAGPTAPGQAEPSQTPTPGSPAAPGAPGGTPLAPPDLSPGAPGPPLGPGTAPGKFPKETPKKAAVPPGVLGGPASKQPPEAPDDDKKKKLADQLKQKGKTPSVPPQLQ